MCLTRNANLSDHECISSPGMGCDSPVLHTFTVNAHRPYRTILKVYLQIRFWLSSKCSDFKIKSQEHFSIMIKLAYSAIKTKVAKPVVWNALTANILLGFLFYAL